MLTYYMDSPAVKDKDRTISLMRKRLLDPDLRVRYLAHQALRSENLLPTGFRLSLKDRFLLALKGKPHAMA